MPARDDATPMWRPGAGPWFQVLATLAVLLLLAVSARAGTVTVGGTGSALQAVRLLAEGFEATHPDIRVEVPASLGTNGGIRAVAAGAIDLCVAARPLTEAETAAGLRAVPWGSTPVMVVVAPSVGEHAVTFDDLAELLSGRRPQWANGEPVVPVLRPPAEADTLLLSAATPGLAQAIEQARARPGMLVAITDQESAQVLTSTPGAVGTITLLQKESERLALRALALNGERPDLAALADGRYPLTRRYWIVSGPAPSAEARALLEHLAGPAADKRLRGLGLLPVAHAR